MDLPRMLNRPYRNNDILNLNLDFNNALLASTFISELFIYDGEKFLPPLLTDSNDISVVYDLANIKFDRNGNLFFKDGNSIVYRPKMWSRKSETIIFENPGYILNFFPFSDSLNYAFTSENGVSNIYKYSTSKDSSRKLFTLPYEVNKNSLINEQGDMLLCAGQELYYYKKDGSELIVPLIDSSINATGQVNGIFQSLSEHALICYKSPNFFVTYDSCKTWFKVHKFSINLPKGSINKFIFWDTSHALVLINSSLCGSKELFEINSEGHGWKKVLPSMSNFNFSRISSSNSEFIASHECYYMKSENGGRNWKYITAPFTQYSLPFGNHLQQLSNQNFGPIIFTIGENQDTLYRSIDFGNTWSRNIMIKKIKQIFRISSSELILVSLVGSVSNNKADIYYTNDNGNSWQPKAKNTEFINNIKLIKIDYDGNLILIYPIGSSNKTFRSLNKGLSWSIDDRFTRFSAENIDFEKDGRCIIYGFDYTNNEGGLYATYDFNIFVNLSSNFGNFVVSKFRILGEGKFIGFARSIPYKNEQGIFYTEDDGANWKNISYNLPDFYSNEKIYDVSDILVDDPGFLYVSLTYDGLWRYNTPLANTTKIQNKVSFEVFPNPTSDCLMIKVPELYQNEILQYEVTDIYGQQVLHQELSGISILNIAQLTSGTYFLKINNARRVICSDKFLKY
ncbi:MAG: T9SS type A sorting domain-containing protein [Saprospiraceae bacterium]